MAESILHAEITNVQIGVLTIEGLLADNGAFYVAVPQIADRFQLDSNQASRAIKPLLGAGFQFDKIKTPLNPKAVNAVKLSDFERLVAKLDRSGNIFAQQFRDDLVGLSLHQLFCDSFGIKFEAEDRQRWLQERQTHKEQFHPLLTVWLKQDADGDSSRVDWGLEINRFKQAVKLPLKPVEQYDYAQLSALNRAEASYDSMRKVGASHEKAIEVLKKG